MYAAMLHKIDAPYWRIVLFAVAANSSSVDAMVRSLRNLFAFVIDELRDMYWSAVADLFACSGVNGQAMSGQGSASQAVTGTLALDVYDSLNSQVALGDANVHVDAVLL